MTPERVKFFFLWRDMEAENYAISMTHTQHAIDSAKDQWLILRSAHIRTTMLSKIARLVKEVRELRKENKQLNDKVQELEDELRCFND